MPTLATDALVVGAAGALGAAVLEHALACGGFARVRALVTQPLGSAVRGFGALAFDGFERVPPALGATAWIVFDRERRANGREDAYYRPDPATLVPLARWLHAGGVRRLVVVLPHAPGLLPKALEHGLASLDEQALAALGFDHLVFVRPSQIASATGAGPRLQRLALGLLAQLRWMVPQRDLPVRPSSVAAFAVRVAVELPHAPPGTRIAPPALVWQAAQPGDPIALVRQWLATGTWHSSAAARVRM